MSTKRRLDGNRLVVMVISLGLIGIGLGFIGYFSIVRASDTTYDDAVAKVEKARDIAGTMIEREDALRESGEGESDTVTAEARELQAKFNQALNEFEQTSAYQHDGVVKKSYDDSSTISRYGKEYVDTLLTQATIGKVLAICDQTNPHTEAAASYDVALEPCRGAVRTHTSVASEGYDVRYYQLYRKYLEGSVVASTSLSKVIENGDQAALNDASQQYGAIEQQSAKAEPELPKRIIQDPRPDFSTLIDTLKQRKQQLWR